MAQWFIHLHDPGFPDPPWPGQRRLGPYTSSKQALEQAASDLSVGMGEGIIAVYTGSNSDSMRDRDFDPVALAKAPDDRAEVAQSRKHVVALTDGTPQAVDLDTIRARSEELIQQRLELQASQGMDDLIDAFRETLPENLRDDDDLILNLMRAARLIG